jgi:hypothetical protein
MMPAANVVEHTQIDRRMNLSQYKKLPGNLFGLISWNVFLFFMPIFLVLGILAMVGIKPVDFNDKPTYGIWGVVWAVVLGPLMSLVTTLTIWIFLKIGNLILRLLLKAGRR